MAKKKYHTSKMENINKNKTVKLKDSPFDDKMQGCPIENQAN